MVVGDPGQVRSPTYSRSEKPGLHMQPRGAGVMFKMLSRGCQASVNLGVYGQKVLCKIFPIEVTTSTSSN